MTIDGATISTEVSLEHADEYTVAWRTLSADGHPIEGTYTFTYAPEGEAAHSENETGPAEDEGTPPTEETAETAPASGAPTTDDTETVDAAPASDNQGNNTGLIIGLATLAVIIAAAAAYFIGRRSKTNNQ